MKTTLFSVVRRPPNDENVVIYSFTLSTDGTEKTYPFASATFSVWPGESGVGGLGDFLCG